MYKFDYIIILLLLVSPVVKSTRSFQDLSNFNEKFRDFIVENIENPVDVYLDITVSKISKTEKNFNIITKYLD